MVNAVIGNKVVCVCGLGYVGLPLALEFAKNKVNVIGFDIDEKKISQLNSGIDPIGETGDAELKNIIKNTGVKFTSDAQDIKSADFVIIAVPTPVTKHNLPDLKPVEGASAVVGKNLKKGAIVILESTVYPGVTEDVAKPILEKESGMLCGRDFKIGYSPERINPGDKEHTIDKVIKVVSGMDDKSLEAIASLYSIVAKAGVFRAKSIKTAEAAKVIENIQRDLNIALVNELSLIFERMSINTKDVLEAAGTKWNFQKYTPGLVGGHCIPVDPYYLVHKAQELGYNPQVILAGRAINNYMPKHVAELSIKNLNKAGKVLKDSKVLLMGLTFKENVKDTRTSPAKDIIKHLKEYNVNVYGYDPVIGADAVKSHFCINAVENISDEKVDGIILMSPHAEFQNISLAELKKSMNKNPVFIDIKGALNTKEFASNGFIYRQL